MNLPSQVESRDFSPWLQCLPALFCGLFMILVTRVLPLGLYRPNPLATVALLFIGSGREFLCGDTVGADLSVDMGDNVFPPLPVGRGRPLGYGQPGGGGQNAPFARTDYRPIPRMVDPGGYNLVWGPGFWPDALWVAASAPPPRVFMGEPVG